ncbi:MAG: glycosyltransferase [Verrucomicrobiota bacterium]
MKVCDVTQFYSPRSGGIKRFLNEKRLYVDRYTNDEHYLIVPGEKNSYEKKGRLHTYTIQSPKVEKTSRYRIILNTPRVEAILREIRPDLIEVGDPYHLAWICQKVGRQLHIPVCGFYHSHFPDAYLRTILKYAGSWLRDVAMAYAKDYIIRLYSDFSRTFVPSFGLQQLLEEWGLENVAPLPLGVDTDIFQPGDVDVLVQAEWGVSEGTKRLLYVGRLAPEKNVLTLLRAFEVLHQKDTSYRLMIIGDGPLRRYLPAVREKTEALVWKSYIDRPEELVRYYRSCDLFVHPGVCETFGLVTLEAQSSGVPVVGIRGSNMDSQVMGGLDLWAQQNNPQALAEAIERMMQSDRKLLGQTVSEKVQKDYGWKVVFDRLWIQYRESIEELDRVHHLKG